MPTLRTSEFTVLQTVGLDAAVVSYLLLGALLELMIQLLNFFRMSFMLFALSAILATVVLMPLNYFVRRIPDCC